MIFLNTISCPSSTFRAKQFMPTPRYLEEHRSRTERRRMRRWKVVRALPQPTYSGGAGLVSQIRRRKGYPMHKDVWSTHDTRHLVPWILRVKTQLLNILDSLSMAVYVSPEDHRIFLKARILTPNMIKTASALYLQHTRSSERMEPR